VLQRIRHFIDVRGEALRDFSIAIISLLLGLGFYAGVGFLIYQYWSSIVSLFTYQLPYYGKITILVMALISGPILYTFRIKQRLQYGFTEIMFGVISIVASILNSLNITTSIIGGAAGVYIVVRGLDNVKTGLDERPSHILSKAWKRLFPEPDQKS
jgi:hypothetical protein